MAPKTGYLQRLLSNQRKYMTSKVRKASTRTRKRIPRTAAEKALRIQQCCKLKQVFTKDLQDARNAITTEAIKLHQKHGGHNVDYYVRLLLQTGQHKPSRKVSDWNAWVRLESQRLNKDLGPGERLKADKITAIAKSTWQKMSLDEQKAAVVVGVKELEEEREVKMLAKRNIALSAFHNTKKTLESLEHQIRALHARTSTEIALLAVHSHQDDYNVPHIIITSPCVPEFFDLALRQTLPDIALRFEGFCLSGVQGVTKNYIEATLAMKASITSLMLHKLRVAAGMPVPRMIYTNFDQAITEKYHVVIEGWPLERFCSPSSLASRNEVSVLLASLESESTRFWKLTAEEYRKWSDKRFDATMELATESNAQDSGAPEHSIEDPVLPPTTAPLEIPQPLCTAPTCPPSPPSTFPEQSILSNANIESPAAPTNGLENITPMSVVPAKRCQARIVF